MKAQGLSDDTDALLLVVALRIIQFFANLTTWLSFSLGSPFEDAVEKLCLMIVIWLILPVVIRLSQRLSHACLSISIIQRNCEWLIKTVMVYLIIEFYMDNRGNSRANTCWCAWLFEGRYLLDNNQYSSGLLWWIIITDRIAKPLAAISHSSFCPISFRW